MSQLILEFPMERETAELTPNGLRVDLGNGVKLVTGIPSWVKAINVVKLQLIMEIEGSPPRNANSSETPIE